MGHFEPYSAKEIVVKLNAILSIRRGSLSKPDIILQLVSQTASDRYLAFGIRNGDKSESARISGDVIVGWVSDETGKGSVDDYFLANPKGGVICNDNAESCPDQSKSGGQNHIKLLNGLSRDNYTMLTFRRPIQAQDSYDVDIDVSDRFGH